MIVFCYKYIMVVIQGYAVARADKLYSYTSQVGGDCRALWGKCERAAYISATEEILWNPKLLSVTQRGHTHELWDVCVHCCHKSSWVRLQGLSHLLLFAFVFGTFHSGSASFHVPINYSHGISIKNCSVS